MITNILVIEDNVDIRENIAEILELEGFAVSTAENAKLGIEKALLSKPDLILCDIRMPELNSYGVLQFVHRHEALQQTPPVFLTSKSEKTEMRLALSSGISGYIVKPFYPEDLLQTIHAIISNIHGKSIASRG